MWLGAIAVGMVAVFGWVNRRLGVALAAWLGATGMVAASGWLSHFEVRPPRLFFLIVPAGVGAVVLGRRLELPSVVWPIAIQTMRLPIELALYALYRDGVVPRQMTFEGRNLDILVGLTAPIVAWAVARGRLGRGAVVAWNIVGLGLLANIVGTAITSMPGPLHLDWPGVAPVVMTTFPSVWLPAFLVPIALFGHVASLRAGAARRVVP